MKYFKVKPENDQLQKFYKRKCTGILIANELYTSKEVEKIFISISFDKCFDIINVNPKKTLFFFGARFESKLNNY